MLGTCEALKSDASEIAAFASQPLCINYQVISENPTIYTYVIPQRRTVHWGEAIMHEGQMGGFRVPQVCL